MMVYQLRDKIAERIRILLLEHDMKEVDLASKMYLNPSTVSRWANGIRVPPVESIYVMSRIFNTTTDYIIGASDERNRK